MGCIPCIWEVYQSHDNFFFNSFLTVSLSMELDFQTTVRRVEYRVVL